MFKKIWNWLDGKKTVIGTVMLFGASLTPEHTVAHKILFYAGSILAGTGVSHKAKKGEMKRKPEK